jgi:hypothetical protein
VASDLWLDEHGAEQVNDWLLRGNPTLEQRAFVRRVLEGVATRTEYDQLGVVRRDLSGDQVAITDPSDASISVVITPYADEETTFSVLYVGDLGDLDG